MIWFMNNSYLIPWHSALLENLVVAQLGKKFPSLMGHEGSLPYSQRSYLEPVESSPYSRTLFTEIRFSFFLPRTCWSLTWSLLIRFTDYHFEYISNAPESFIILMTIHVRQFWTVQTFISLFAKQSNAISTLYQACREAKPLFVGWLLRYLTSLYRRLKLRDDHIRRIRKDGEG
jgi:hypothetical protein